MIIYTKHLNFFISRGISDDLFIRLCDNNLNSLTQWLSFKDEFKENDLRKAIKLVKSSLKNGKLYSFLEV